MQIENTILVLGGSGGLGNAFVQALEANPRNQVLSLGTKVGHQGQPAIDYRDESSLINAAIWVKEQCAIRPLTTVIVATGFLHSETHSPERSWAQLDAHYLQHVMLINAIGPALAIKHFSPLLPKDCETNWVMISAKVGSIGDNALGGWYGYRASKAALNQIVKTASVEMTRRNKQSICVAIHPGTVATKLSEPFSKTGLNVRSAETAASEILEVIQNLQPLETGSFVDYQGNKLPW
jgi:NAD(P)-dependent dehydrogenase (short-subunit alcohol dehydrogenase family)